MDDRKGKSSKTNPATESNGSRLGAGEQKGPDKARWTGRKNEMKFYGVSRVDQSEPYRVDPLTAIYRGSSITFIPIQPTNQQPVSDPRSVSISDDFNVL